jgi:hypothetical protein
MKLKQFACSFICGIFFLSSCTNDDEATDTPLGAYDNGVLILNQGGFGNGNASMSYLSNDITVFQNNIFSLVNPSIVLGDTAQDVGFYNDLAYIVLNGSNKIEIVNRYTMAHVGTISSGLSNPRYIAFVNGKGYVSNWGNGSSSSDDFIAVINLTNNSLLSPIPVAEGPERMVVNNSKIYVAHTGGFGFGSTVSVLNTTTSVVSSIAVGDVPNSLEIVNNNLYVLNGGKPSWSGSESSGSLTKINLLTDTVFNTINFAASTHPSNLEIENGDCYFTIDSDVFKMAVTSTVLPSSPIFSTTDQGVYGVYSLAVKNNKVYVGDAVDYSSNGKVHVYTVTGDLVSTQTVGVIPAGFYFN